MNIKPILYNSVGNPSGGGGQLIPGMGGMNPTGADRNNPTGIETNAGGLPINTLASSGLSGAPGDATIGGGSGVMAMPTPTPTPTNTLQAAPVGNIGGSVPDTNVGLIPGTNISSGFPANTAGTVGGTGSSGISDLNLGSLLGFNANDPNMISQLDNMFGKGVGAAIAQFLGGGAGYNPAIATALINQMAPQEERTRNQILESFGASGGRYSSPAAIGLADYESSYSLGQQGILANLASQATDRYSNLFSGVVDTAYLTQANKLSPWNIISGIIGLLPSLGIKIPGTSGGGGGGSGAPGSTGPAGPQGRPGPPGQTAPPTGTSSSNINFDPNNPFPITYTPSGQPNPTDPNFANWLDWQFNNPSNWSGANTNDPYGLGTMPGQGDGSGFGSGPSGYDWQDPTGGGSPTTPTIPIDSSTQYTTDWFGSSFGDFFGGDFGG